MSNLITDADRLWNTMKDNERDDLEAAGYDPDWKDADYRVGVWPN